MKKLTLGLGLILLLGASVQVSFIVESFPGFRSDSECAACHNEPATTYNASLMDSEVLIDGVADDEMWDNTYGRQMRVPVVLADPDAPGREIEFITTNFGQNATHIFVQVTWEDYTPSGASGIHYAVGDGISIIWNIDQPDMHLDFFAGMKADEGTTLDAWTWKPSSSFDASEVNTTARETILVPQLLADELIDDGGWDSGADTSDDVVAAATWGYQGSRDTHAYTIEFARPLVTDDVGDVQFDKIGYYEFAIALYNDSSALDHHVSFPHSLWVYGACETDCDIPKHVVAYDTVTETEDVTNVVTQTTVVTDTKSEADSPVSLLWVLTAFSAGVLVNMVRKKR